MNREFARRRFSRIKQTRRQQTLLTTFTQYTGFLDSIGQDRMHVRRQCVYATLVYKEGGVWNFPNGTMRLPLKLLVFVNLLSSVQCEGNINTVHHFVAYLPISKMFQFYSSRIQNVQIFLIPKTKMFALRSYTIPNECNI